MDYADITGTNKFNATDFTKTLKAIVTATDKHFGSDVDRMDGKYKSIALYTDVDNEATKNEYFEPAFDADGNITFTPTKHDSFDNPDCRREIYAPYRLRRHLRS